MRHLKKGRKFGRVRRQRKALLKNLASSLIEYGKIKTTLSKSKELKPYVERLVTYAKKGTKAGAGARALNGFLSKKASFKLIHEVSPKYTGRKGGYTRIIKLPARSRDAAKMAYIEFI